MNNSIEILGPTFDPASLEACFYVDISILNDIYFYVDIPTITIERLVGPQGPQGDVGSRHQISVAISQSPQTIQHNLGIYPDVIVVDESGNNVECIVNYIDSSTLTVSWNGSLHGRIYLG